MAGKMETTEMKIIKLPSKNLQLGPLGDEILSQNKLKTANYTQVRTELLRANLWSIIFINIKTLFVFLTMLTLALMVQQQRWVTLLAPSTIKAVAPTILVHTVLFTTHRRTKQAKLFLHKNVFDVAVNKY